MRNDLYGTAAVISMTFLVQNRPVNFTRCNVGILIQAFIDKPFVMSQIQVCLRAIILLQIPLRAGSDSSYRDPH